MPKEVASLMREVQARRKQVEGLEGGLLRLCASLEAASTVRPDKDKEPEAIASEVRQAHLRSHKVEEREKGSVSYASEFSM